MAAMHLNHWRIFVIAMAGWMNREQPAAVEFLKEENHALRELLGEKRLSLNGDQRRRPAAKGKALGRKLLATYWCILTPATILQRHLKRIARKYDGRVNRILKRDGIEPAPEGPRTTTRNESIRVHPASFATWLSSSSSSRHAASGLQVSHRIRTGHG